MQTDETIRRTTLENIERMMNDGAEYCDVRYFADDQSEALVLYDGNLEQNDTTAESGIGVRVLWGGAWGFAATSTLEQLRLCFDRALQNAKTASHLVKLPLSMGKRKGHVGTYASPVVQDPFSVPLNEKLALLQSIDNSLREDWIARRIVSAEFQKRHILFWNSEGTEIEKRLTNVFGDMIIMAVDKDGQMQQRGQSLFTTGNGTRGWELISTRELFAAHAERIKGELDELRTAEVLEFGTRSVILLPGQGFLQVHETIGHPLELDRILGYELSYAGGSLVKPEDIGSLRYGNEKLNVSAYGGIENSPGTFGYDDEGTPERDYMLIEKGILVGVLSSRAMIQELNHVVGRNVLNESGGAARATAFYRAPIDRMTNVNIVPGNDGSVDDIIGSTENGIIVDNATSWSIGSNREHFHFACEIAWEVQDGKRGRVLRNPTYQGHTLEFYGALSAVGDHTTWRVEQVENCGKGEPNQIMQLGHGIPVVRFDDVISGERG